MGSNHNALQSRRIMQLLNSDIVHWLNANGKGQPKWIHTHLGEENILRTFGFPQCYTNGLSFREQTKTRMVYKINGHGIKINNLEGFTFSHNLCCTEQC